MTVTISEPERLDSRTWRTSWSSDLEDPAFYVYRDGYLVAVTALGSMEFHIEGGESLVLEILDDADALPAAGFPGRLLLAWNSVDDADHYMIEEYVDSEWMERAQIADAGKPCFTWRTRFLEDCTEHQFRITPVGTNGNEGDPLTFIVLMVRHPDVPDVAYDYDDETAKVTISAA